MSSRKIATVALTGVLLVGGTGAAIAAVTKNDGAKNEQAVLDNAAKQLNVTPEKLRDALASAQDAQIDQAVKDGKLTQQQADAIKAARKKSGRVLEGGIGGGGFAGGEPGHRGPGRGFGGMAIGGGADLAKALGITQAELMKELRAHKTMAAIATAHGKTLADVQKAVGAAQAARLAAAVKAGKLTQKQADAITAARKKAGANGFGMGAFMGGRGGMGPGGGHGMKRGPGFGFGPGGPDLAKELGLSPADLMKQLKSGKSIADIAKAQGKSLDAVKAALKADAKTRSDAAVKAGKLTQAQADKILAGEGAAIDHLGAAPPMGTWSQAGKGGKRPMGPPPMGPPQPNAAPPAVKPGVYAPASQAPGAPPKPAPAAPVTS
ncbi:MAG TPA: hypothetical protein VHZ75_11430 [Solirubrobacteraceae bacterium]|nr:hypothetical protein [Solirubrobacteraceae bacterium]